MKYSINSLHWNNSTDLMKVSKSVVDHLGLSVQYHNIDGMPHGAFMDEVIRISDGVDVVGFFDVDCVPVNKDVVEYAVKYAYEKKSFIGLAQASNHIPPKSHIFASPAFFFIHRDLWFQMGQPSFLETNRGDVAEEVSYRAEELGVRYRSLLPTHYAGIPDEGVWRLGNVGLYGVGTHFMGGVFHLFQGRMTSYINFYEESCKKIIDGSFTPISWNSSFNFEFYGPIVP